MNLHGILTLFGLFQKKNTESSALCIMEVSGTEALEMEQDFSFFYGTDRQHKTILCNSF